MARPIPEPAPVTSAMPRGVADPGGVISRPVK
jgi:hypothetical protein